MIAIDNRTNWAAGLYPGHNRKGQFQFTAVFKAGFAFDLNGQLAALPETAPIEEADRYRGVPGESSLATASEAVPFKQGGELLLSGTAYPPTEERTVIEVAISLRRAEDYPWRKALRVFGPRRWEKKLLTATPSRPDPLEPLPLIYEHAFGGAPPGKPEKVHALNPVGRGYSETGWRASQLELPQIEMGPVAMTAPGQKVAPAGFGPISPTWEPRLSGFQNLDQDAAAWGGAPFGENAPADIWNAAPADQRFAEGFAGGEELILQGVVDRAPSEGVRIQLPVLRPHLQLHVDGRAQLLQPTCDTLSIDANRKTIEFLWRTGISWNLTTTRKGRAVLRDLDLESSG